MTARQQWTIVGGDRRGARRGTGAASHFMRDELFPVTIGSDAPDFRAKVLGENRVQDARRLQGPGRAAQHLGDVVRARARSRSRVCSDSIRRTATRAQARRGEHRRLRQRRFDSRVRQELWRHVRGACTTRRTRIERAYQATGYPETFVIGPEGTIRKKWIGPDDWSSQGNRALIAQLLGLSNAAAASGESARSLSRAAHAMSRRDRRRARPSSLQRRVVAAFTQQLAAQGDGGVPRGRALVRRQREGAADRARARALHAGARQLARAARSAAADSGDRRGLAEGADQAELEPAGDPPPDHAPTRPTRSCSTCARTTSTLPEGVDAVVRDVEPRSVTLRFESTWTRKVPVRSAIDIATPNGRPGRSPRSFDPRQRARSPARATSWCASHPCARRGRRSPSPIRCRISSTSTRRGSAPAFACGRRR